MGRDGLHADKVKTLGKIMVVIFTGPPTEARFSFGGVLA
jgi:hypothetical protein